MDKGIMYVATGSTYTKMALESARSAKKLMPALPIHLFTDQKKTVSQYIDSIGLIESAHQRSKVDHLHLTPFHQTLYLDADTFIKSDLLELFSLLKKYDLALAHAHRRNTEATLQTWRHKLPPSFPQLNSGVVLYNQKSAKELFVHWTEHYSSAGFKKDQVTLRELIWLSDLKLYILPPEYNVRFKKYLEIWEQEEAVPKILHFDDFTEFFAATQKL